MIQLLVVVEGQGQSVRRDTKHHPIFYFINLLILTNLHLGVSFVSNPCPMLHGRGRCRIDENREVYLARTFIIGP